VELKFCRSFRAASKFFYHCRRLIAHGLHDPDTAADQHGQDQRSAKCPGDAQRLQPIDNGAQRVAGEDADQQRHQKSTRKIERRDDGDDRQNDQRGSYARGGRAAHPPVLSVAR
jgi:hypothetical protein